MRAKGIGAATLVAAALALGACGGGGGSSSSSSTASNGGSTSSTSSTSTTASVSAFCDKVQELQSLGSTFQNLGSSDLSGAQDAFSAADQKISEIDDVAPAQVKSDVDKVKAIFDELNSAVQGASNPADLQKNLTPLVTKVQDLQSSVNSLKSFGQKNCNK
jgi:hypothetical protein